MEEKKKDEQEMKTGRGRGLPVCDKTSSKVTEEPVCLEEHLQEPGPEQSSSGSMKTETELLVSL